MIVAAYVNNILWTPVNPVVRIERITPVRRDSRQSDQQKNAFAQLLAMTMSTKDTESNGFDSRA